MDNPKFKNDMGVFMLRPIFYEETQTSDKSTVVYTLKDRPHEGFPSLYQLYMAMEDLTEYEFANKYLDSWSHWVRLCECPWFKPYVARWREELSLKLAARSLKTIMKEAKGDGKQAVDANKYLLEKRWIQKETTKDKVGRPTKEAIKEEAQKLFEHEQQILADYNSNVRN